MSNNNNVRYTLNEAEKRGSRCLKTTFFQMVEKYKDNRQMLYKIKEAIHEKVNSSRLSLNEPIGVTYVSMLYSITQKIK